MPLPVTMQPECKLQRPGIPSRHLAAVTELDDVAVAAGKQLCPAGALAVAVHRLRTDQVVDVEDEEDGHDDGHEHGVEDVQEHLVRDEVAAVALQVLDDAEDAADHDERAGDVEDGEVAGPRDSGEGRGGGVHAGAIVVLEALLLPQMECDRRGEEEAENGDLDKQADDDDLLANIVQLERAGRLDSATPSLQEEGEDVACDEDLGHPPERDDGEALSVYRADQTAKYHIYRGGVQRGCDEYEDRLHDEATDGRSIEVGPDTTAVADDLD